ncbi:MAG TPA: heme-binding protein [Candidatus Bathyarchaeia archaeon]|jgi:glc operon protein GlcG|nr:heme-binding protein [Candidatus Bathyarchaeia archaeon]
MKTIEKLSYLFLMLGLSLAVCSVASAQTAERKSLTLDGAERVIAAAKAHAAQVKAPGGVIAVVDAGGNLIALERLDGTFAAGASISIGKARTAVLFQKPTKVFEDIINKGRTAMAALPDSFFTPLQGGIPVLLDGQIIGAVGVSGASSAAQDEELAIAGAEAANTFGADPEIAATLPVSFFAKTEVDEGFAKGSVLFDGAGGRNYMVHTSRREGPGMVEVHTKDTDILYVLKGSATVVTGGSMVDGKPIAADEIRGREITGGESRKLAPGDAMIIPSGVPHWFREVQAPFLYYVVKVR